MSFILVAAGTVCIAVALLIAHSTLRVVRSNPAAYDANRVITGNFAAASQGLINPASNPVTDYKVNHYVEAVLDEKGRAQEWRRAGSLSDEAVDGVLARQY